MFPDDVWSYHFWLEHELSLIYVQCDVPGYASILYVYTFPVTLLADLTKFEAGQNLWVDQRLNILIFCLCVQSCRLGSMSVLS